jgi:hypothetical protein
MNNLAPCFAKGLATIALCKRTVRNAVRRPRFIAGIAGANVRTHVRGSGRERIPVLTGHNKVPQRGKLLFVLELTHLWTFADYQSAADDLKCRQLRPDQVYRVARR